MAVHVGGRRYNRVRYIALAVVIFYSIYYLLSDSADADSPLDLEEDLNSFGRNKLNEVKKVQKVDQQFLHIMDSKTKKCPDYTKYSTKRHHPFSEGKLKFPYMRPAPKCRTFVSDAVEHVIEDLKSKIENPDLARMVENSLPNTLDTTVLWHVTSNDKRSKKIITPQSFIVTGDIHAEWLRDSAWQLSVYQPFAKYDPKLQEMIKGAINTQVSFLLAAGYCNAFHPPAGSGVKKGESAIDNVRPFPDWDQVFECKYELDSLASFLTLSNQYYENTQDKSFITDRWLKAVERLLVLLRRESSPTFDKNGRVMPFYYTFQRNTNIGTETLPLAGTGNPVNFGTGLVRSAFRPSDDACIFQFFIPANMHIVAELKKLSVLLDQSTAVETNIDVDKLKKATQKFIESIEQGIETYGIIDHPKYGKVYAYEVDGYGGTVFMDDANIPSLLSAPDLGYLDKSNEVYQNTRKMILSKEGNPYYLTGRSFSGIGGPHIGINNAWPMSLLVAMRTSDDDDEIKNNLRTVLSSTGGLGLVHESVYVNSIGGQQYTRSWFAWGNSEFGKTILDLAERKPHLIFKPEYASKPYNLQNVLQEYAIASK